MFDHDDHGDQDDRDDHDESSHLSHSRLRNIFSVSSGCYWHQPPPGRNDKSHLHDKYFHGEQWWAGWWRSSPERVKEAPIGGGPFLSKVEKAGVDEINVVSVKKSMLQKKTDKYSLQTQNNMC